MKSDEFEQIVKRASGENPTEFHDSRKAQEDRQRLIEYVLDLRALLNLLAEEDPE